MRKPAINDRGRDRKPAGPKKGGGFFKTTGGVTVYERLQAYCIHQKLRIAIDISHQTRKAIGEQVRTAYFGKATKKVFVGKRKQREPEGTFEVLVYPNSYSKVIDAIIFQTLQPEQKTR